MMISRGWFRWLCATRHQPIIWANVDPVLCHHMSSPDHNELTWMISENDCSLTQFLSKFGIYKTCISAFCRTRAACVDFTYQLPYTLCWYGSERTVTAKLRQSWSFGWCQSRDITSTIFDARHQWWEARVKMFECWKNINIIKSM